MTTPTIYEVVIDYFLRSGVIASILIFAYQVYKDRTSKKKESNERIFRVCKTIKIEVDELDLWYKSPEYQALKTRDYIPEFLQRIEYSESIINKAPYDGILSSGLITYLQEETQKSLYDYYFYVDLHNKRMFNLAQIYNDKASSPEFKFESIGKVTSSYAWKLNISELTKYEKEMRKMVPKIKRLLDEEIKSTGVKEKND